MPWHDWQFWIVSIFAVGGLWLLLRPFLLRKRGASDAGSCSNCATPSTSVKPRRVNLTIEKRRV